MDKYIDSNGFRKLCERIVNKTAKKASLDEHIGNKSNPHGVTKSQVGLGNVSNVTTNNQTPTYTTVEALAKLVTGEKLGVAFGKIAKAVDELITHISDTVKHVTAEERTAWNGKAAGNHTHSAVTQSAAGFMSADDKKKLDGVAASANNYSLPLATASVRGGTKIGYTANGKNYPVQLFNEQMFVNVPWTDTNTTYSNMTGASASAAGTAGLVPAPAKGNQAKYLRGDGTWQTPPDTNTTYSAATQSAAGLMSAADKKKLDGVASAAPVYMTASIGTAIAFTVPNGSKIAIVILNSVQTGTNSSYGYNAIKDSFVGVFNIAEGDNSITLYFKNTPLIDSAFKLLGTTTYASHGLIELKDNSITFRVGTSANSEYITKIPTDASGYLTTFSAIFI